MGMSKKVWVATSVLAVCALTAGATGVWYWKEIAQLDHGVPYSVPAPAPLAEPVTPQPADNSVLASTLENLAANPRLASFGARVADPLNNQVVWEQNSEVPLQPASSTKLLTTLAALKALGPEHRVTTSLLPGPTLYSVIVKAGGDVWLTEEQLDRLVAPVIGEAANAPEAAEVADASEVATNSGSIPESAPRKVDTLYVDTSVWAEPDWISGWHPEDIGAGYIAPIQPLMLNKAVLGDLANPESPRSGTPARDVIGRLAERLGARVAPLPALAGSASILGDAASLPEGSAGSAGSAPEGSAGSAGSAPEGSADSADSAPEGSAGSEPLSSVESPTLQERLRDMLVHSDNVAAEAIGREIALSRGLPGNSDGAARAVLDILAEAGCDTSGTALFDTSGLSVDNRIPAALLGEVMDQLVLNPEYHSMIYMLPVAGGTGTLADRYTALSGRGWVRAKTGTLTGTSALVGMVPATNGHIYTFALISNGGDVTTQREAMDALTSAIRDF